MRVQDLKNYGRSYPEAIPTMPPGLMKKMKDVSMKTLRRHLGLLGMARFLLALWGERRRLMKQDDEQDRSPEICMTTRGR